MIAGMLRILGVDFGSDSDLMAPSQFNPKGYFEHVALNGINVDVMAKFGGDWYAPPNYPPGWQESAELEGLRKAAAERLSQNFGRSPIWGFKDPRSCVTLPFWRKVIRGPIYAVIVVRNPIDAARSVQNKQRILESEASELWFKYMVGAFLGSHGLPRHVVCYEDALDDVRGEFHRLASFLKKPVTPQMLDKTGQFSDRRLRHYESTKDDVAGGRQTTEKVKRAYLTMRTFVDLAKAGQLEPEDQFNIESALAGIR